MCYGILVISLYIFTYGRSIVQFFLLHICNTETTHHVGVASSLLFSIIFVKSQVRDGAYYYYITVLFIHLFSIP